MSEANLAPRPAAQGIALDRPAPNAKSIMQVMEGMASRLASVATKHLTPEKLLKMIGVQMQRVPKLGNCTPISVLDCAMTCSELGLAPGVLGDAYLVPYKETCTLVIGYRGLLKLARRSGHLSTIQAEVVREGDEFQYRLGMEAALNHIPKSEDGAKMTHVWAMAKFRDGSFQFVVLRATEVEAIRKRSKAGNNGPWVTDTGEMWKKTALRRLCKMLPLTAEIEQAIATADKTEFNFEDLGIAIGGDPAGAALPEAPSATSIAADVNRQIKELDEAIEKQGSAEGESRPATEDELKRKADAYRLAHGCKPDLHGCAAEMCGDVNGKPCCLNHMPSTKESSGQPAGDALPGMSDASPTNRPPKRGR